MKNKALLEIPVPNPFHLHYMSASHGWVDLLPYRWASGRLHTVIRTRGDQAVALEIESEGDCRPGQKLMVKKTAGPRLSKEGLARLEKKIRWCFRLDEDFTPFQKQCGRTKHLKWVKRFGLGPFLRNSDLFEEFTKVLITTNINWAGTKNLNNNLLNSLGQPVGNERAFPTAERVAGKTEAYLRDRIRLGYRAPFLLELARTFASGRIDTASLDDPTRPLGELKSVLASLKGFGPYAVNSLLITFNRYEELILDSWIRRKVHDRYFKGRKASDDAVREVYRKWKNWAALACWFECAYDTWFKNELQGKGRGVVV